MKRLYFDFETDGVIPKKYNSIDECPHAVQLAAILVDDEKGEVASMNVIITQEGREIPKGASDIHGILTEDAENFGVPVKPALAIFSNLCRAADQIVAHNIGFDSKLYEIEIERLGQFNILKEKETFCTMLAAVEFCKIPSNNKWSEYKWPKLIELHEILFEEGFDGAHSALEDVKACARCHKEMLARGIC